MFFHQPFSGLIPGAKGAVLAVMLRTGKPMTGRHVSVMVGDRYSLWAVQMALKELVSMGLVEAENYGRSTLHRLNDRHALIPHLQAIASPVEMLRRVVIKWSEGAEAVILFGSIARNEAQPDSDIDLAVVASEGWPGVTALQNAVWDELGNRCDVLLVTHEEFLRRPPTEPVVEAIIEDGIPLVGAMPTRREVAQ